MTRRTSRSDFQSSNADKYGNIIKRGDTIKFTVCMTDASSSTWFSRGAAGSLDGIFLSYHIIDRQYHSVEYDNPRTSIPWAHLPGDKHYLSVEIPASFLERGGAFVDLKIVKEGCTWWGNAARVPLKPL